MVKVPPCPHRSRVGVVGGIYVCLRVSGGFDGRKGKAADGVRLCKCVSHVFLF